ncbi:hypothetical protein GGI11_003647 [Coemansia sp. RSA 2049]|nr:hypothetical protein GGI11_003647 [Coemansia sp. RSA 2049]KAJ2523258.1 hypothetical protein H4217_000191 [Coemansia sp. RSA 1939]
MSYRRLALFDQALFNTPDAPVDVRSLVALCYHGIPDVSGLRALCWQILVGYLPPDRRMWARVLQSSRESYAQLVKGIAESLGSDPGDNGGSAQALLDQIRADIQRTMPDIAAFRNRIETSDSHEAHNNSKGGDNSNSSFIKDECDTDGDDDDDARCNTIVSDLTVLSMESAESCATITSTLPRRQHSSAALATHESGGFGAGCAVSRLRRALGEKIAAATATDPVDPSFCDNKNGVADTQIKHRLSRWLLSRPQTHAEALARILFVHARFNRGAGYVQGMNELLAPLYYVLASNSNNTNNSKRIGGYRASECEADAFHMLILAMRDEHLDMFISAMDTTATAHISAPSPPRGSARHKAVHYSGISDRELDAQYRRAQNAANAHHHQAAAQVSAFALPVTAYNERNRRARRDSGACNKEAKRGGSSNVGGLQNAIRRWWDSYVRIADAQLWRRLEALGVHPEHFAVRWLLVWGAREFPLPDVLVLWDSLMANRARLAAAPRAPASLGVKPGVREAISRAMTSRAANSAHYHHQHKESEYGAVRTHIGRLRCEVRMRQGVSGDDDGDRSQLGFLFDFFTAVLVAMRGQLLTASFEKCIALLQQLPRDAPELEMHSLIESALRLRADRAGRRAVQACTAVLATVDRGCLGLGEPQGLSTLYSLYGPSVSRQQQHRRRASRNAATTPTPAAGLSGSKVSRFFGQLSGRIGQTVQTLLSQESDDETNSSSSSSIDTASGRRWPEANSADVGEAQWSPECVFVVAPAAPGVAGGANAGTSAKAATSRVAVYEMACFDRRSLTATVVLLGECDGLRPQLASVQSAQGVDRSTGKPTVVSVRLPAPYAVSPPPAVAAAATRIAAHGTKHHVRVATTAGPGYRGAGAGIGAGAVCGNDDEELTATDPTQQMWWKSMEPVHTRSEHGRPTPARIELCDYDCDGDDVY